MKTKIKLSGDRLLCCNNFMRLLGALLFPVLMAAQTLTLTLTPASVPPGQSTTLNITYTDPTPTADLTSLQFQPVFPAAIVSPLTGPAASFPNGNYIADFNPANLYTLIGGWGTTFSPWTVVNIPTGKVASWVLKVSPTAALGPSTISLNPATATTGLPLLGASTAPSSAVALTANTVTLTVTSIYDLNGDGVVNAADLQIARNIALGLVPNGCVPPFSLVGDGKCDIVDVTLEWLAALGIIH